MSDDIDVYGCDNCRKELGKHSINELKECLKDRCEAYYELSMGDDI